MSISIHQKPADFYILRFAEYSTPGIKEWDLEDIKVNGKRVANNFFCQSILFEEEKTKVFSKIITEGNHVDYTQTHSAIIISEKLAGVLLPFNDNAFQLLPIDIIGCSEKHYILNTLHSVDFIDFDNSIIDYISINDEKRAAHVVIWQIKQHYIPEKIFRCRNNDLTLIIHKDVFAAMYDASITGCDYYNLEDHNDGSRQLFNL